MTEKFQGDYKNATHQDATDAADRCAKKCDTLHDLVADMLEDLAVLHRGNTLAMADSLTFFMLEPVEKYVKALAKPGTDYASVCTLVKALTMSALRQLQDHED